MENLQKKLSLKFFNTFPLNFQNQRNSALNLLGGPKVYCGITMNTIDQILSDMSSFRQPFEDVYQIITKNDCQKLV